MKSLLHTIKYALIISFLFPLLAGCSIQDNIKEQYPLESVNGSGSQTSYVYRAANSTVPETAAALIKQGKPKEQSPEDNERMFLVYDKEIIHLQRDAEHPQDTLVEVDSKEYVRQNYSSNFLQGYLVGSLIRDLFDNGRYHGGDYRGYTSKDVYKPQKGSYRAPTTEDKKKAPPVTVNRTGSIFKRSKDADTTFDRNTPPAASNPSKGKITRDTDSSSGGLFSKPKVSKQPSSSGNWFSKPKSSKPKVKIGSGRVFRRR
ncbi:DUF4247 domain-containing protein [Paenibacillus pinihumi]|uniref:DUF4247 domain-containing protein n=1 Tax=Paenibacillus pinihumi TaxID=669462 RepID=UPI00040836E3|nr:DUF4247 domain-containing protein [Paenibacillus pinihumi]